MTKFIGDNKVKTAVFISGAGTNLKNLINFSKKNFSPITIKLVISNKINAKGKKYAINNNIIFKYFNFNKKKNENIILSFLKKKNIELICLAGFMKILSENFIKKYKGKIINIHPSLLPKYKGLNTHYRVIYNKEKYTGCTVHYVNKKVDAGKIILRKKIKILKLDNEKSLEKKVKKIEYVAYPKAILKIYN